MLATKAAAAPSSRCIISARSQHHLAAGTRVRSCTARRASTLVARATQRQDEDPQQDAHHAAPLKAPALAMCVAAMTLLIAQGPMMAQPQAAQAAQELAVLAEAIEQEEKEGASMEDKKGMLEFMLQRQENAKKAAIMAQRQMLQVEVNRLEASIQAQLNQQRANVLGASKSGDERAAESAKAAASELEEKQARINKAAAQLSSQLDRMELLERARTAAARQMIQKATQDMGEGDSVLTTPAKVNPWVQMLSKGIGTMSR